MPTLRNITCRVLWPEGTQFKEVATTYGDGIVETYTPIPSDRPQKFYIHVRSRGYIYEGLAVVVFIDGVYQCNRNRVNLVRPKNGKPVYAPEPIKRGPKKGQQINLSEVDWNIRQEEKPLDRRTHFLGSDWRFDDFKKVEDNVAVDSTEDNFQGLGTIDVIILRCAPNPKDKVSPTDYDSGAESDVLNNHLTGEDAAGGDPPNSAGRDKKESTKDKNGGKGDNGDKSGKGKGGGGGGNTQKGDSGQAAKVDKDSQRRQDNKKPAEKSKAASVADDDDDDDDDDEPAIIAGLDGPADEYYRGSQYYSDPGWPGYAQPNHYGHPDQTSGAQRPPPYPPQGKHVHWDMGPGQPRPPEQQHHDYYPGAHSQIHSTLGYGAHPSYGQYPSYNYSHGHQYQQPPPYAQAHGVADPYHSHQGQHYPAPGHPAIPQHYPAPLQHAPAHAPAPTPGRYPSQVGYSQWPQYSGGAAGNANQPTNPPAQEIPLNIEEAGGWKYVEPKRKTQPPPTITNFNGWEFDKEKGTWVPVMGNHSGKGKNQESGDSGGKVDEWGNTTNGDKNDDWENATSNDNQNDDKKSDDGWGGNNDNSNNYTNGDDNKKNDWGGTSGNDNNQNGASDWQNDQGNTQGGSNDWSGNQGSTTNNNEAGWKNTTNTQSNGAMDSKSTPNDNTPRADRTLHGPLGAYFGPKIAVESDPDVPWIADEPPAYDLPSYIVNKLGISKQVQRGKGYNHVKKHRKPIYIDSITEPYARFVFKYRTRDKLPRGFDKLEGLEPTPDHMIQQLQERKKEDLIAELQRWRLAYGDKAPEPKIDLTPQKEPDHAAWNLDLPKRDYLNYQLPGQFPDEVPANTDNKNNNQNKTPQANNSWDNNTNNDAQKPAQRWDQGNTTTTNDGHAGAWDSGNNSGGGGEPRGGW